MEKGVPPNAKRCHYCDKTSQDMKRCSKCKAVRYCNFRCQRNDWKMHKNMCKQLTICDPKKTETPIGDRSIIRIVATQQQQEKIRNPGPLSREDLPSVQNITIPFIANMHYWDQPACIEASKNGNLSFFIHPALEFSFEDVLKNVNPIDVPKIVCKTLMTNAHFLRYMYKSIIQNMIAQDIYPKVEDMIFDLRLCMGSFVDGEVHELAVSSTNIMSIMQRGKFIPFRTRNMVLDDLPKVEPKTMIEITKNAWIRMPTENGKESWWRTDKGGSC